MQSKMISKKRLLQIVKQPHLQKFNEPSDATCKKLLIERYNMSEKDIQKEIVKFQNFLYS